MTTQHKNIRILFALIIIFLVNPVSAAITTISPGNTVFMGEQGLDITTAMDGDTQLGWWASAASIADTSPSYFVSVSNPASFSITPSIFHSQTGSWYHLNPSGKANGTAFIVAEPQLALRVEDTTVSVDVTDKWVPTDDEIRFRLDTNLVAISQRSGVTTVPITIKVQDPSGGIYTSLINNAGTATSIVNISVTTTPYYTASIWDTGQRAAYSPGTYTIWAECNINSMKDNYDVAGKTVSQKVSLLNQEKNPLIGGNYPTTTTTSVTTKPATAVQTTVPIITTPPTSQVPVTIVTTDIPVTQLSTQTSVTATPTSLPTKSPGFEGLLTGVATLLAIMICSRKA
jgi:hypothetical protein